MNLRDLSYFVAVAKTGHFGRAAQRCFVSQPTLSGQIKKLEASLGLALFERSNKKVTLTPAGEALLEHARRVLAEAEALKERARTLSDPLAGPLRLGVIPTLSPYLVPFFVRALGARAPQMKLSLVEDLTEPLLDALRRHEIDAALIATAANDPLLSEQTLFDEPFWLAHPRDSALYYHEGPFTHEELAAQNILLLAEGHCLARQVARICGLAEERRATDTPDLRASSLETLLHLVGSGFGCTLIPALALRGNWMSDSGVVVQPLEMPEAYRSIRLVWRNTFPRREALKVLREAICSNLPNTVRMADRG